MTWALVGLLVANGFYLVIGAALLPLLRIARTRDELYRRLGLAYILGLAATTGLGAHLALIGVPMAWGELVVLALVVGVLGRRRFRDLPAAPRDAVSRSAGRFERTSLVIGIAAFVAALVLLAHAMRTFAVRPLVEWDGWAIWAMKARALYDFGGVEHGVFTTAPYGPLQHPLFLPSLEASKAYRFTRSCAARSITGGTSVARSSACPTTRTRTAPATRLPE